MLQTITGSFAPPPTASKGLLVRFEIRNHAGKRLHDGRLTGEFPDRGSAVEIIKLHLQQFDQAGFDRHGGFWWGRSLCEPCEEMRFFVR